MRLEAKKYLLDIQRAAVLASEFVSGKTLDDYHAKVSALLAGEQR